MSLLIIVNICFPGLIVFTAAALCLFLFLCLSLRSFRFRWRVYLAPLVGGSSGRIVFKENPRVSKLVIGFGAVECVLPFWFFHLQFLLAFLITSFHFSPSLLPFPTCLLVAPTRQKITNGSTEGKGFEAFWVPHKAMPAIFRSGSTATSGAARPYLRRRCGRIGRACFRCPPLTCRCEPRPRPDLIASCVVHGIHDPFSCHKRVDANFEDVRSRRRLRPRFCCARVEKTPPSLHANKQG